MSERSIYAHWLDPDYTGRHILPHSDRDERLCEFGALLKTHAMAGDCIYISDVQLIESPVLLLLFANDEFRRFLTQHPRFLRLVARPTDHWKWTSERFGSICSGLAKIESFGDTYIANTFASTKLIPSVAALFQQAKSESESAELFSMKGQFTRFIADYKGSDGDLVRGLSYALEHFLTNSQAPVRVPSSDRQSSYYDELTKALSHIPESRRDLRHLLDSTIGMAKSEPEQFRRTLILAKLVNADQLGHPDRAKYLLVAQAWNVAVGGAVGADCDSAYCFRDAFPIPVHSELGIGRTTCVAAAELEDELFASLPGYKWNPSSLSWNVISKIRAECVSQIEAYQGSVADIRSPLCQLDDGGVETNFAKLSKAAAKIIAEDRCPIHVSPMQNSIVIGTYAGAALLAAKYGWAPKYLVTAALGALNAAYSEFRNVLMSRDAQMIGEALMHRGLQYNLHRPTVSNRLRPQS